MRKRFWIIILASVFLVAGFGSVEAKTIKVGAAINLTGPASSWGNFTKKVNAIISVM